MTTTCLGTVVGGRQANAPCKLRLFQRNLFLVSVEFNGDHMADMEMR